MSKIKKTLLVTGSVLAVGASSLVGASAVSAHASSDTGSGPTALIQKIAEKFGLNEADVKSVFDEEREVRQAERRQNLEERLTQAVADGKITDDQNAQILSKLNELETFRGSLSDKSEEGRREAMKDKMDELKDWAEENDIPFRYLHFGGHHGPRGGMGEMAPALNQTDQEE